MKIPSYESWRWRELWQVLEYRGGAIYKTKKTEWHVPADWIVQDGWTTAPFSTSDTRKPELEINPHPEFK